MSVKIRLIRCFLTGHDMDTPLGVNICPRCGRRFAR